MRGANDAASRKIEERTDLAHMISSVVMISVSTWGATRAWDRFPFDCAFFVVSVTSLMWWVAIFVASAFKVDAALSAEGKREGL